VYQPYLILRAVYSNRYCYTGCSCGFFCLPEHREEVRPCERPLSRSPRFQRPKPNAAVRARARCGRLSRSPMVTSSCPVSSKPGCSVSASARSFDFVCPQQSLVASPTFQTARRVRSLRTP
jgi:hypothetical protein